MMNMLKGELSNINIKADSRKIEKGDIFVAIKGKTYDGHNYINEAIKNGASKIVCEYGKYNIDTIIVNNTSDYLNKYLTDNYYKEIENITFIGVTGTNGKTTTCYLLYQMLNKLGVKSAYIGTIGFYIDDKIKELERTTPELFELYEMFLECKNKNVEVVVMEVSSHSLELGRVYGIKYDYAIFTNLTEEHLAFHGNMEKYLNSKLKLFDKLKDNGYAIVNVDNEYSPDFLRTNNKNITYGYKNSDYQIENEKLNISNTVFSFKNNKKIYTVKINFPGKYNIYNFISGIIVLNCMGYNMDSIIKITEQIKLPKGRTDIVSYKNSVIIVDYAHTPDAVLNILNNGLEFKKNNIYTILGCGGGRDKSKRGKMGRIATELSDYVIFTNDNPRFEDEKEIMNDIVCDLKCNNYEILYDRKEAIKKGVNLLENEDILFILGKGHESYQIIGKEKYHFDDKEEVNKYIEGIK